MLISLITKQYFLCTLAILAVVLSVFGSISYYEAKDHIGLLSEVKYKEES